MFEPREGPPRASNPPPPLGGQLHGMSSNYHSIVSALHYDLKFSSILYNIGYIGKQIIFYLLIFFQSPQDDTDNGRGSSSGGSGDSPIGGESEFTPLNSYQPPITPMPTQEEVCIVFDRNKFSIF